MERSKTDNRSAIAQAIERRDDAMRDILGIGSDPVGTEVDKRHKPPVGIWRIAGNGDRSRRRLDRYNFARRSASRGPSHETYPDRGFRCVAVPVVVLG